MGLSAAMPLLLIGLLLMATVGGVESSVATSDDDQPIISPPPQSYNGGQAQVQGAQEECSVNGGECIALVYRVFRGGAEQTSPVCCKMMMEMSQNCLLLIFPNPNVFPFFRTYCVARYGDGGSDTAPGAGAGAAGPPAPAPMGL